MATLVQMAVTRTSRIGKTYYLHVGPKAGGGVQYYFSTKSNGQLAEQIPEGYEVYETVNGQVYLRRRKPRLIGEEEEKLVVRWLRRETGEYLYKVEVRGKELTIHECCNELALESELGIRLSSRQQERRRQSLARYMPVMRFVLVDGDNRLFKPERYCFRGSVEDWIDIGPPDTVEKLTETYLKHLGRDSLYELY